MEYKDKYKTPNKDLDFSTSKYDNDRISMEARKVKSYRR